ncbi:MAG: alpha/beta hydrolase-fold protein [Chloroflexia bacterium]
MAGAAVSSTASPVSTMTAPRQIGTGNAAVVPASTITAPRSVAGAAVSSGISAVATTGPVAPAVSNTVAPTPAPNASSPVTATPQVAEGYLRDGTFYSDALGRTMPCSIYFPPGYDQSVGRYPVLYMLHGSGGHYSEWVNYGLAETAERLIQSGRIAR